MQTSQLSQHFEDAAAQIKIHGKNAKMSNDDLLTLYGLYKQATEGDNTTDQPSFYQFEKKAKWAAWNVHKSKNKDQAKHEYVENCCKFLPADVKAKYQ